LAVDDAEEFRQAGTTLEAGMSRAIYVLKLSAAVMGIIVIGTLFLLERCDLLPTGQLATQGPVGEGLSLQLKVRPETDGGSSQVWLAVTNESRNEDAWADALRQASWVGLCDFVDPRPEGRVGYAREKPRPELVPPGQTRMFRLSLAPLSEQYLRDEGYRTAARQGRLNVAFIVAPRHLYPRHVSDIGVVLHSDPIRIDPDELGWE
jgi:hypothetical protein